MVKVRLWESSKKKIRNRKVSDRCDGILFSKKRSASPKVQGSAELEKAVRRTESSVAGSPLQSGGSPAGTTLDTQVASRDVAALP